MAYNPAAGYTFGGQGSMSFGSSSSRTTRPTTDAERAAMGYKQLPGQVWNGSAYVYPSAPAASAATSTSEATTTTAPLNTGGRQSLSDLTKIADPWSTERDKYKLQLSEMMADPSKFQSSPMFQASLNKGVEAVNRSAAAKGMLGSGNRLTALMDYGQGAASDNYFKMADLLSTLGGAKNQNPGGGLQASVNQQNADTNFYNAETGRTNAGTNQLAQQLNQTRYDNTWAADQAAATQQQDLLAFLRSIGYGG